MKNMRPFQIIVIAIFGVLALVGLFVFSTFSGFGNSGPAVGTVVIWGTLPQTTVTDALATLKNLHKQYASITYVQKQPSTFDNDLANALASGSGPDLVIINQEQLLSEAPKIETIPFSSIPQRTYLDAYLSIDQLYLNSTGTYAIPLTVDPLVLYYNRTLLSSAGVATPPTTWEAVTGLAPTLTKQDGSQNISQSTIAFGGYANVVNARAILSLLFLQAGSPITQTTTQGLRSVLGSAGSAASNTGNTGAAAALNFYTQFANPAKTVYSWNPGLQTSRDAFIAGDLALYVGFASEEAGLKAANPNLDFDMAPIPQPGTASTRTTYGLAYAFAIPKAAVNKSGAYDAAVALSASDVLPSFSSELGMAPAKSSLLVSNPADPYTAVYYPEALNAKGWLSPAPGSVDSVFSAMITNVTTGRLSAQDALSAADQSLDAAF